MITSFDDLLTEFTPAELAGGIGVKWERARKWIERGSVPPAFWPQLMVLCRTKGLAVDMGLLATLAATRKVRPRREKADTS